MVLRDLIASVITGSTVNVNMDTATDMVRAVIDETGAPAINVSIGGGGTPTFANLNVTGDLHVSGDTYQHDEYIVNEIYIGPKNVTNSWRFIMSNQNLLIQVYDGLNWLTKGTFYYA